jgi:hypothetical protein
MSLHKFKPGDIATLKQTKVLLAFYRRFLIWLTDIVLLFETLLVVLSFRMLDFDVSFKLLCKFQDHHNKLYDKLVYANPNLHR